MDWQINEPTLPNEMGFLHKRQYHTVHEIYRSNQRNCPHEFPGTSRTPNNQHSLNFSQSRLPPLQIRFFQVSNVKSQPTHRNRVLWERRINKRALMLWSPFWKLKIWIQNFGIGGILLFQRKHWLKTFYIQSCYQLLGRFQNHCSSRRINRFSILSVLKQVCFWVFKTFDSCRLFYSL